MPSPSIDMASNEVLTVFLLCSTVLIIKMYMVAVIVGQVGLRKKAFANLEDTLRPRGPQYCRSDSNMERCLRAHQNDMETIYPFLFLGLIYTFLGPQPFIAWMHFIIFLSGCIVHSVAYLGKLRAPIRSLAYVLAKLPCLSMAFQIIWEASCHL